MKKYLIVFAALAFVFAGCKKEGDKYTSIKFKEAERTMVIGAQEKFALVWEPTSMAEPSCTWASSDEEVLTVDENGNVSAVGLGEANIVAKCNELQAVCHVTVEMYEAMWAPSGEIYYFPDTKSAEPLNDSVYQFEYPSGIYECRMYSVEAIILNALEFDGGIGEGDCVFANISALFITKTPEGKEQFKGSIWDLGLVIVEDSATYKKEQLSDFPGKIDPAITGAAYQSLFEQLDDEEAEEDPDFDKFKEDYAKGVSGAHMASAECTATGVSWYPWYDGIIKSGYIKTEYDEETEEYLPVYKFEAQWCYGYVGGFYTGLQLNKEAESYSEVLIQPFEENLSNVWRYETGKMGIELEENNAAQRRAPKFTKLNDQKRITKKAVKVEICKDRAIVEGRKK